MSFVTFVVLSEVLVKNNVPNAMTILQQCEEAMIDTTIELRFGKYKGKSIGQVFMEDPNYVSWLGSVEDMQERNPPLHAAIQKLIKKSMQVHE